MIGSAVVPEKDVSPEKERERERDVPGFLRLNKIRENAAGGDDDDEIIDVRVGGELKVASV